MFWTPRLCRICATIGAITYPMFSSAVKDVEAKFKKCFKIIAFKDDFKPKDICGDCLDKLDEYCMFVDLCIASNNKFESILYQTNRSELQDNWQNRIDYKLDANLFSPTENGVIVKADDLVLITPYKDDGLNIELQANRDVINESALNIGDFDQNPGQTVLRHSSEFYNKNCNLDDFSFNYQRKDEVESVYVEKINFENTNTKKVVEVLQHDIIVSKSNKVKIFTCNQCGKNFKRNSHLKAHMSTHTNVKPFRCDICYKSFSLRSVLSCHKNIHTSLHKCEYCSKTFSTPSKLERHVRTHTNVKPFKCEVGGCDKSFSDKRNLVGHQAKHSNNRTFLCDVCKKYYKTKGQLNDHKKVHLELTYSCDICSKGFKWRTNLAKHVKKHSDFHCKKCKIDFRNRSMFLMHREECSMNVHEQILSYQSKDVQ